MGKRIFDLSGIISIDGLEAAKKGLKDLGTQFQQAEKSFYKFGRQIGSAGSKLTSSITLPIIAAAGAATLAAKSFGDYGDKILDMSKNTGLSTDSIQELKQVASDTGTEFEGFVDSIFKVTKNMPQLLKGNGEAAATFRNLKINVFDANGQFRDMNVLFPEIIKKLQNVEGETNRTALAQTIFGKGAGALLDVLSMTNKEFDASRQKARDLGLVMSGDALKAADDFRVALNDATNQLVAMGRQATLELLPLFKDTLFPLFQNSIIPALKSMGEKVAELARWFNNLDESTKKIILGITGFAVVAGPALIIASKMIGAVAGISAAMKIMQAALSGLTIAMATNPFTLIAVGAAAALAALVLMNNELNKYKNPIVTDDDYAYNKLLEERMRFLNIVNKKMGDEVELYGVKGKLNKEVLEYSKKEIENLTEHIEAYENGAEALAKYNAEHAKTATVVKPAESTPSVTIIDPEAIEAEKRKQEEIAKVNAEYNKIIFDNTLMSDEARYEAEKTLALNYVKSIGADVALAENALDMEHQKKVNENWMRELDNAKRFQKEKEDAAKEEAAREFDWTLKLLEQDNNRLAILEANRIKDIESAKGKETEIAKIEAYYRNEKKEAEKELKEQQIKDFADKVNSYISVIGQIGSGIASIFQQSTANKQMELDNQQQAEREVIEKSTMSEKGKRKAIAELDKKQDKEQRAMRRKAAAESKKISIFESIINTASAVVAALGKAPFSLLNFVMAGIVGTMGAIQTALIAAAPLPLARGAMVKGGRGGLLAQIGEGSQNELVIPLKTGAQELASRVMSIVREQFTPMVPAPFAMAGGGGGGSARHETHYHMGAFVTDEHTLKDFERRQLAIRNAEAQRKGQL